MNRCKLSDEQILGKDFRGGERWFTKLPQTLDNGESVAERPLAEADTHFIHWHQRDLLLTGSSDAEKIKNYRSSGTASSPV
jgi:hypothetical protein